MSDPRMRKLAMCIVIAFLVELFAIPPACTYYDLYIDHWQHVREGLRNHD